MYWNVGPQQKFESRAVLITGCSSGIGLCVANGLKARGYRVIATARKAEDVEALLEQGHESIPLDLRDSASISAAVEEILSRTGGTLYGLFNNGAYGQPGAVEDLSRAVLREQFETNLFGTHELTSRVLPVMRAQGHGRIIQNSSVLGMVALAYRGAYSATKFALEGLSDTLRIELAETNIHVILIEPGPIASRFRANAYAAFTRNIDAESSVHRERYLKMATRFQTKGPVNPGTLPPEAVLKRVLHALESPRPRPRYYVTFPTYLFATLRRLLPWRALDRVVLRICRNELK
jgi:NAD(P)-dependent dehydrogenase (short-subunit alcohol dehydrogenase family)